MSKVEIAGIKIHDGRYELLRLDIPPISGASADRIGDIDRSQLEKAVAHLLPEKPLEDGLKRILGGAVVVGLESWLRAKRSVRK